MDDEEARADGYTVQTVSRIAGFHLAGEGIRPVTYEMHVVADGGRAVATCSDLVHAERIAALLNTHGLVDLEGLTP